jgi:hypothetical protein
MKNAYRSADAANRGQAGRPEINPPFSQSRLQQPQPAPARQVHGSPGWPATLHFRQPLLDGARILLAEDFDPETPIVTRHAGDAFDAMISTVGEAAKWMVRENETEGPRFVRWTAFPGVRGEAPMRYSELPVPNPAPDAEPSRQPAQAQLFPVNGRRAKVR